eukprot:gb/GECG01003525.1/.p1 GENE.gb/GECG01003525.1/~~gb/GECG01003525.1/.p1  ORF type:complete len:100 (+),score=4.08 gb/GECG01003525.1/:1-300(+)
MLGKKVELAEFKSTAPVQSSSLGRLPAHSTQHSTNCSRIAHTWETARVSKNASRVCHPFVNPRRTCESHLPRVEHSTIPLRQHGRMGKMDYRKHCISIA